MPLKQICALGITSLALLSAPTLHAQAPPATSPDQMVVDHIAIYVQNLDRSVAFYKDLFGFKQIPQPIPIAVWLSMGKGVALHIVGGRKEPVVNSKWEHLSIACADIDAMIATLNAKHIPWASFQGKPEPFVRFDGVKQIFIQDPDGYWIEINDTLKPKPPAANGTP